MAGYLSVLENLQKPSTTSKVQHYSIVLAEAGTRSDIPDTSSYQTRTDVAILMSKLLKVAYHFIRTTIKTGIHLPKSLQNSLILHQLGGEGDLGLFKFRVQIPRILLSRSERHIIKKSFFFRKNFFKLSFCMYDKTGQ